MTLRYTSSPTAIAPPAAPPASRRVDRLDLGPQIAVWIESADRAQFVDTLMVTNMTAARGIGNRPGVWNFLSGPFFPYGKRRMALPIWAHARGKLYDTVVMQDGHETWLGVSRGAVVAASPTTAGRSWRREINVDAITCPTRFTSVKGKLDPSTKSYYPPRNDLTMFFSGDCDAVGGTLPGCTVSAISYAALNDLDAVAAATPAYGAPYSGTWRIPAALAAGDYALLVEVNKEFDNNASHRHPSYEDPQLAGGTACPTTSASRRSSIACRFTSTSPRAPAGPRPCRRSPATATGPGEDGAIIPRDATISTADPGSGEARLLEISTRRRHGPGPRQRRAVRLDHLLAAAAPARRGVAAWPPTGARSPTRRPSSPSRTRRPAAAPSPATRSATARATR